MKRILVIDDDPEIVDLMKNRLEANNYFVDTAYNGEEGLVKAKNQMTNLIILDIAMPKMDGYTFVLQIKAMEGLSGIPVVMLTAKENMKAIFEMEGVKGFFVKPFVAKELLKRLYDLLGE